MEKCISVYRCMNCVYGRSVLVCCCVELRFKRSGTTKILSVLVKDTIRCVARYEVDVKQLDIVVSVFICHTQFCPIYTQYVMILFQSIQYNQDASIPIAVMVVPFNIDESLVKDAVDDRRDTIWRIGPNHHSCYNTICCESSHYEYHQSTNRSGPNDQNEFRSTTPIRKIEFSFLLLL